MGYLEGHVVVNPPMSRMEESELDLVVAGTSDAISWSRLAPRA